MGSFEPTPEQRRAIATYVVDNTGSLDDLRARVGEIYAELRERSA